MRIPSDKLVAMSPSKILTVIGATGRQGGSVVKFVGEHPCLSAEYSIRAVVRDPAKATLPDNVEVVQGDLNDVESLKQAFSGSHVHKAREGCIPQDQPDLHIR